MNLLENYGVGIYSLFLIVGLIIYQPSQGIGQNSKDTTKSLEEQLAKAQLKILGDYYAKMHAKLGNDIELDSLQEVSTNLAERYYDLYKKHPKNDVGKQALVEAFGQWMTADSLERMIEIHKTIPINSDIWGDLTGYLKYAYTDKRGMEKFIKKAENWLKQADNMKSKAKLVFLLGQMHKDLFKSYDYQKHEEWEKPKIYYQTTAMKYFEKLFKWHQDSVYIMDDKTKLAAENNYNDLIQHVEEGQKAPNFAKESLDDQAISLTYLQGNVVLLDFWASWCAPCIRQIPHLKDLWKKHGDHQDFRMISVTIDSERKPWKKVIRDSSLEWTHIFQENNDKGQGKISGKFGVGGVPNIFLIDKEGYVVEHKLGYHTLDEIDAKISELLSKSR